MKKILSIIFLFTIMILPIFSQNVTDVYDVPLLGEIESTSASLFLVTALIAFVDGFNPCSLWVLTFLLSIVLHSGSRLKIFVVGFTFLSITTLIYGGFMIGLFKVLSYIAYLNYITIFVAIIALIFGIINVKDYFWFKKGISLSIPDSKKPKLYKRVRNLMKENTSYFSLILGTSVIAIGITLIELPCTSGFPLMWNNILSANSVSTGNFSFLLFIYLLIYLLDELLVFLFALFTLKRSKLEEKHGKFLKLIGGLIMIALAFSLLFMPELMLTISGTITLFSIALGLAFLIAYLNRSDEK